MRTLRFFSSNSGLVLAMVALRPPYSLVAALNGACVTLALVTIPLAADRCRTTPRRNVYDGATCCVTINQGQQGRRSSILPRGQPPPRRDGNSNIWIFAAHASRNVHASGWCAVTRAGESQRCWGDGRVRRELMILPACRRAQQGVVHHATDRIFAGRRQTCATGIHRRDMAARPTAPVG